MRKHMHVVIVNFEINETIEYIASSLDECRDQIDRMVYELACIHGEAKVGQTLGYIEGRFS